MVPRPFGVVQIIMAISTLLNKVDKPWRVYLASGHDDMKSKRLSALEQKRLRAVRDAARTGIAAGEVAA
jgi:hypothetical protein